MHVRLSPSGMLVKSLCVVESETVFWSRTKGAGWGVVSVLLQFGPRAPMKDVLPTRTLLEMVKLRAEDTAMPYPNAPVRELERTVPEKLILL